MQHLYVGLRVMYPQFMTAACKAVSEHKNGTWEETWVRLVQPEGGDGIATLKEQIMQLQMVIQKPQMGTPLSSLDKLVAEIMRTEIQTIQGERSMVKVIMKNAIAVKQNIFSARDWDMRPGRAEAIL